MSGLSRPKRSREIFASYSTFHQRMEEMLQGIETVALSTLENNDGGGGGMNDDAPPSPTGGDGEGSLFR